MALLMKQKSRIQRKIEEMKVKREGWTGVGKILKIIDENILTPYERRNYKRVGQLEKEIIRDYEDGRINNKA